MLWHMFSVLKKSPEMGYIDNKGNIRLALAGCFYGIVTSREYRKILYLTNKVVI